MQLSFRQFIETQEDKDPPDLYNALDDELNTGVGKNAQISTVFDWVPFDDGVYRFGQDFQVTRNDKDDNNVWIKPVTGQHHGDEANKEEPTSKLICMKCARKTPDGKFIQIKCPPLEDTKEFPISRKKWTQIVNKPFAQAGGGAPAAGELPGMGM